MSLSTQKISLSDVRAQEQLAIIWIVGQMESYTSGILQIPMRPEKQFLNALEMYNQKVEKQLDYLSWRKKIMSMVSYIKARKKAQKKAPWYRPYFLHLLGRSRLGMLFAKEPGDYIPALPVNTKTTNKRKQMSEEIFEDEEILVKKPRRVNMPILPDDSEQDE